MSNFETGRIRQKLRTRDALVATAIDQLKKGKVLSVAEVADLARVGRTTAYRYFPTQTHLLAQTILRSVGNLDEGQFDDFFKECADPGRRIEAVVATSDDSIRKHEAEYRAMLRLSLDSDHGVPHRAKFRISWLAKALAHLRQKLGKKGYERLLAALGLCVGIEPSVVLQDIYGLSANAARDVKLWAANAMLNQALQDASRNTSRGRG